MPLRSRRARLLVAASTLLVPAGLLATVQPAAAAPTRLVAITSTLPRWLPKTSVRARAQVAVPDAKAGTVLDLRVYLAPTGGAAGLAAAASAASDPASASYGQFLSAAAYQARFAPTASAAKAVSRFLTSHGLHVTGTGPNRRYVSVTGDAAHVDKAFGVTLKKLDHDGQSVVAPTTAAVLPASVASKVLTISGLDTSVTRMTHRSSPKVTPPAGFRNARPCSRYYGQVSAKNQADFATPLPKFASKTLPYAVCGYTGPQFRSAYEGDTTLTGQGVTVAITDAYRWQEIASDANTYASQHGDGSYARGQLSENVPAAYTDEKACDPSGWSGEETLDVEAVHAMAPDAKIRYYASASCNDDDFADTLARVADEDVAKIVSNSWGSPEEGESADLIPVYESVLQQSALEGISVLFSSGDSGDEVANTAIKQSDYPASDPYVTAVGGTATGIGADGARTFDAGWGTEKYTLAKDQKSWTSTGYQYGAGGGVSGLFNQPAYQRGVVPSALSGGRAVPDVAMDADPTTGMLVGQTQKFADGTYYSEYRIGGTSLASPLLAGLTALSVQHNSGRGFGLLNPRVYAKVSLATDVTPKPDQPGNVRVDYVNGVSPAGGYSYSVRTFGRDSSLAVTKGWDQVTGIGVPNATFLGLTTPASSSTKAAVSAVTR